MGSYDRYGFDAFPTGQATGAAVTGASSEIGPLEDGRYVMSANIDVHFRQGATGGTAVTTDELMQAGRVIPFRVEKPAADACLQFITDGGTGRLWYRRLGSV